MPTKYLPLYIKVEMMPLKVSESIISGIWNLNLGVMDKILTLDMSDYDIFSYKKAGRFNQFPILPAIFPKPAVPKMSL